MARNKYPEETIKKILEVSYRLFLEKGYEQTSIQDIVEKLGMSKGAIYHHFKTKDDILDRISEVYYAQEDWFEDILQDSSKTGLEKLRALFVHELEDEKKKQMDIITLPLLKNPRIVMKSIIAAMESVAPQIEKLLLQGNSDGSIHCSQPKEAAQVLLLLANLWINPGLFPVDETDFLQKIKFLGTLLTSIGIPLVDDSFVVLCTAYYHAVLSHINF